MLNSHTSSVERFSENFDDKAVTYIHHLFRWNALISKNVIFEKIPWAPSEDAEVAEVKRP